MSMKHTPGPWAHKPRARDGHVDIVCKGHAEFVHVGCPHVEKPILDYPTDDEQTANARLIAAAPELLEALKDLLGYRQGRLTPDAHGDMVCAHYCGRDYGKPDDAPEFCMSDDCPSFIARAAIAKAEGVTI